MHGQTPIFNAGYDGNLEAVLLDHGADVNSEESYGCTPLYKAASDKHLLLVDLLRWGLIQISQQINFSYPASKPLSESEKWFATRFL